MENNKNKQDLNKEKQKGQDDKKQEEQNEDKKVILTPEELNDFLEELKEKYNIGEENIKIVKIERKKPPLKILIVSFLLSYLFDFLLIIALNGYLGFTTYNIWKLLLFSVIFSTLELLIREILMRFFPKLMFYSLGTILIPISISALLLAWWITGLEAKDNYALFFIIFLILRLIMNVLLMKRNRDKMFNQIKGGRNGK
ncbi:MAG: hypothetical protein GX661_06620 [Acholeplasmataceae bacterium]|nr:hypothetical protein [Acholeplasmataceae bacterium]